MITRLAVLATVLLASGCLETSDLRVIQPLPAAPSREPSASRSVQQIEDSPLESPAQLAVAGSDEPMLYVVDGSVHPERRQLPIKSITFDDLKFDIERDSKFHPTMLTPKIEEFIGRRIRVRGFIFPPPQQTLRSFVLTRDNNECCFGPGAAIYDCIQVVMAPNKTAEYTLRPVTVEGVLALRETLDIEGINSQTLYYLDAESVQ